MRSFSNRASASPPVSRKTTNDRPTSHRKTTNDSSGRSKSVVSRRTTSGSHERNRSKDRKTTALSGSGSRAGRSSTSEEDHESEDSEVDVENVPFHLRKAVPLHLVEARILKKSEKGQPSSPTVTQDMRRRVAQQYVPPDEDKLPDEIYDPAPMEAVMVRKRVIILLIAGFFLWCFAMLPLLAVHVLTFYLSIGVQTHRANADAIFGKLEAMVAQELTPALNLVYMLSVQASMGLFNVSEPYWAITRSLAYTVQESKQMQYVKVVGAAEHMLVFRPGNLHYVPKDEDGDGYIDVLYAPDQITGAVEVVDDICQDADPFFCFDITPDQWSRLTDSLKVDLPSRQLTAWWLGPEFLTKSKQNEVIASPDDWPLIIRFLAHVNVTEGLPSRTDPDIVDPFGIPVPLPARVSLDIALGVDHMGGVLQDVRPDGGEVFILAADGSIIAGAGWQARPAIGESGELYQKIWEMQFEWAKELTPEAVVAEDRIEFMTSASDLVQAAEPPVQQNPSHRHSDCHVKLLPLNQAPSHTEQNCSMSKSTVYWSPGEASLSRASLNKLLQPGDKLDVTEAMMKAATIGRAAEMGEGWEPPGMISRKIADLLSSRSPGSQGPAASLGAFAALLSGPGTVGAQREVTKARVVKSASLPTLQRSAPVKTNWATMVPRRPLDGK